MNSVLVGFGRGQGYALLFIIRLIMDGFAEDSWLKALLSLLLTVLLFSCTLLSRELWPEVLMENLSGSKLNLFCLLLVIHSFQKKGSWYFTTHNCCVLGLSIS